MQNLHVLGDRKPRDKQDIPDGLVESIIERKDDGEKGGIAETKEPPAANNQAQPLPKGAANSIQQHKGMYVAAFNPLRKLASVWHIEDILRNTKEECLIEASSFVEPKICYHEGKLYVSRGEPTGNMAISWRGELYEISDFAGGVIPLISPLIRRHGLIRALCSHDGVMYDGGNYKGIFQGINDPHGSNRINDADCVSNICCNKGELYYSERECVYKLFIGRTQVNPVFQADGKITAMCSHDGELVYAAGEKFFFGKNQTPFGNIDPAPFYRTPPMTRLDITAMTTYNNVLLAASQHRIKSLLKTNPLDYQLREGLLITSMLPVDAEARDREIKEKICRALEEDR